MQRICRTNTHTKESDIRNEYSFQERHLVEKDQAAQLSLTVLIAKYLFNIFKTPPFSDVLCEIFLLMFLPAITLIVCV